MAQEVEKKTIWDKVGGIDYRIIYVTFIILLVIPILSPIGIPMKVGAATKAYYDNIFDPSLLPDGSFVLFHNWVSLSIWADMGPIIIVTFKMIWSLPPERDIKIISYQSDSDAYIKVHDLIGADPASYTWDPEAEVCPPEWRQDTYGESWVDMGYVPGLTEAGYASMALDFTNMITRDYYETPIMDIPIIQEAAKVAAPTDVLNAYDFELFIWGSWGCTSPDTMARVWWTQGSPAYHLPQLFMTIGNCVPNAMPYYGTTNCIRAYIPGAAGAAELELLTGYLGEGTKMADICDLGGVGTLFFLILGNIAYFGKRFLEKKEE